MLGHTFALDNGMSVEPWGGAQLDWIFLSSVDTEGFDSDNSKDSADLRLQAGLNWTLAENAQLSLTGEVSGLFAEDSELYAGEVNLALQF